MSDDLTHYMEATARLKAERDEALERNTELGKMYLDAVSASQGHEMDAALLEVQRDALRAALRDAIPIMWTARKSEWHAHDRALKRFERDHADAIVLAGLDQS